MEAKRIEWIDIARAIFIIAIVIGHTFSNPESNIRWFVFAFHVPAWFFISGLLFKPVKDVTLIKFLKKKLVTIVIPYVLMSLISILIFYFAGHIIPRINTIVDPPLDNLRAMLYSNSNLFSMRYNLPLWFLPCMFVLEIIGYFTENGGLTDEGY